MIAEEINYTMEECEKRLSPSLFAKLQYSGNLLQKAEKLALAYDAGKFTLLKLDF